MSLPDFEQTLVNTEDEEGCCQHFDPKKDPEEVFGMVSMVMVVIGLILITVGYLTPRNFKFDPDEEARKMEAIEQYYSNLSYHLDIVILVGMGFVAFGGLLYTAIFVSMFFTCLSLPYQKRRQVRSNTGHNIPLSDSLNQRDYGAIGNHVESNR